MVDLVDAQVGTRPSRARAERVEPGAHDDELIQAAEARGGRLHEIFEAALPHDVMTDHARHGRALQEADEPSRRRKPSERAEDLRRRRRRRRREKGSREGDHLGRHQGAVPGVASDEDEALRDQDGGGARRTGLHDGASETRYLRTTVSSTSTPRPGPRRSGARPPWPKRTDWRPTSSL